MKIKLFQLEYDLPPKKGRFSHLTFGGQAMKLRAAVSIADSFSEPDALDMLHIDGDNRCVEQDFVEDEVAADSIKGLLIAWDLCGKECREVVDGVRGLHGASARADVFICAVVRNGSECDIRICRELDDLLVVLERGKVDAVRLGIVVKVHNAHVRQPLAHRREGDLTLLAHDALKFITQIHLITSFSSYYTISPP